MPEGRGTVSRNLRELGSRTRMMPSLQSNWMQRPAWTAIPSPNQLLGRCSHWSTRPLASSTRRTVDSPYSPVLSISVAPFGSSWRPCVKAPVSWGKLLTTSALYVGGLSTSSCAGSARKQSKKIAAAANHRTIVTLSVALSLYLGSLQILSL
eukprot:scaffold285621_cov35-Tisochrysis_lutea.AAC.1